MIRSLRETEERLKDSLLSSRSGTWGGERLPTSSLASLSKPSPSKSPSLPSHRLFLEQIQAQIHELDQELNPHSLSFSSIPATPEPATLPPASSSIDSQPSPQSPDPVTTQQHTEEIQTLKHQLQEANKTIKTLQNQLKMTQFEFSSGLNRSFSDTKKTFRSRENSLKRYFSYRLIEEKDSEIREERKTIARVQGLNRVLLEKLKEIQEKQDNSQELQAKIAKNKKKGQEIKRLKGIKAELEEIIAQKEEEIREIQRKYDKLRRNSEEFVSKTENLYEIMRRLVENIDKTRL